MKKSICFLGMILTCVFALTACQTPGTQYYPSPQGGQQQAIVCAPAWAENPEDTADALYGQGFAKLRNQALTMEAADARSRTAIVRTIKTHIESRFKDFMQESGIGEDARSLQVVESISKQISSETLYGSKIKKRKFCPDGTIWSLAILPLDGIDKIKSATKKNVEKYVKQKLSDNENAQFNEFKAKQAFDDFQKELDQLKMTGLN
jgi:hypothetical protein